MKKISILVIVVLLATLLLTSCGGSKGTIVMATEAGFRPYEYFNDENEIVGIDVEIAKEIAKELKMDLEIQDMVFDAVIPAVNSGKADFGAAGLSKTAEREEQVDFTIVYATSKQVILTTESSGIYGEADLSGRNVGAQLGTVADIVLEEDFPDVEIHRYNKYFEAANDLSAGRIDAIVLDSLPAQELARMNDAFIILDEELFTDEYAICVQKGNETLLNDINKVLQRLLDEGKIAEFTAEHIVD